MNKDAYSKRQAADRLWEIVDSQSGDVILIERQPLCGLDDEQAADALDLLRAGELTPDPRHAD